MPLKIHINPVFKGFWSERPQAQPVQHDANAEADADRLDADAGHDVEADALRHGGGYHQPGIHLRPGQKRPFLRLS